MEALDERNGRDPELSQNKAPQAQIRAQGQHKPSLFPQHGRAPTLPMSPCLGYQQSVPKLTNC